MPSNTVTILLGKIANSIFGMIYQCMKFAIQPSSVVGLSEASSPESIAGPNLEDFYKAGSGSDLPIRNGR